MVDAYSKSLSSVIIDTVYAKAQKKSSQSTFFINYSPADVDNVRLLLTRMMSDPTTKVFSLFLDTLYDFLSAHKLDLGSWLYILLTRLFNKMSAELLPSVQAKLDRCFDLIRASFAAENQFQSLLKYVNDSLQTPNLKVNEAYLNLAIRY